MIEPIGDQANFKVQDRREAKVIRDEKASVKDHRAAASTFSPV